MPKRGSLPPRPLDEAWKDAARHALVIDDPDELAHRLSDFRQPPSPDLLMVACKLGSVSCTRFLIGTGVPLDTPLPRDSDFSGDTALSFALRGYVDPAHDEAAKSRARACAMMLLERTPGYGDKDPYLFSSHHALELICCCVPKHKKTGAVMLPAVQLLLNARVDPNVAVDLNIISQQRAVASADDDDDRPLFTESRLIPLVESCRCGAAREVVDALLKAGADPRPALQAVHAPRTDPDDHASVRLEMIRHAVDTCKRRGKSVRVEGLEKDSELNGCHGTLLGDWVGLERWGVHLDVNGKTRTIAVPCDKVHFESKQGLPLREFSRRSKKLPGLRCGPASEERTRASLKPMLAEMPDESEDEWCTAVCRALQRDDIEELARLQACGDAASWELLVGACTHGAVSCARELIEKGARFDVPISKGPNHGDTALNAALKSYAKYGRDEQTRAGARACAMMLLELSPGYGDEDPEVFSAHHAVDLICCCVPMHGAGHRADDALLPAVHLLLEARVDPNVPAFIDVCKDWALPMLPLVESCRLGAKPEVVVALLKAGARPEHALSAAQAPFVDLDGKSATRLELITDAIRDRQSATSSVDAKDSSDDCSSGDVPQLNEVLLKNVLHSACTTDDVKLLQLCLERGASVNAADAEGHSPLWRSVVEASCLTPFHSPPPSPPALSPPLSPSPPPAPPRNPPQPPCRATRHASNCSSRGRRQWKNRSSCPLPSCTLQS